MDGVEVRLVAIGGDLEIASSGRFQFFSERHRIAGRAASKVPRQDQLCVALHGDEAIGVTHLRIA